MIRTRHLVALLALSSACAGAAARQPSAPNTQTASAETRPATAALAPPVAQTRPHEVRAPHGAVRNDEYYWLRDDTRQNADMLAYLQAENAYTDRVLSPLAGLQRTLYDEIVSRIVQDDSTVPYRERGYWYYVRFEHGKDYPIEARRKGNMEAPEEVMLDQNAMAQGKPFFDVDDRQVSQDNRLLAFAEDTVGRRQYVIRVKDLSTGELLPDAVSGVSPNVVWADDNQTFWYVENDPTTLLAKRVKAHRLGTPNSEDTLVYEEADDAFELHVFRTRSDKYLCVFAGSTLSSEQRCAPAASPSKLQTVAPRERDVEYLADHHKGRWVIRTNWKAPNFRIMTARDGSWEKRDAWQELVPHDSSVFIEGFQLFDTFLAIDERSGGLRRLRVLKPDGKSKFVLSDEPAYTMVFGVNSEPGTKWLRYTYESLTTPKTTYEINVDTDERKVLKRQEVPGGHDPANYVTERLWAPARDGTRIPVSVVYRKGLTKNGSAALLQKGYGSYGISSDPYFGVAHLSLLDRGVVIAIAHVRGGQELGRKWYENGKLLTKINTFTDFIDVTSYLVSEGYAHKDRVAAMGGSAGGLLMGAISNMAPEKYRVVVSLVPFVDVVTTMLDPTIPLTTVEYDEWGNPEKPEYYDYMLSYSPYDQLKPQDYPAMFIGTGLWDSQVQYYEPAKYVARLRTRKTDARPVVFRIDMESGHGGASGRFQHYHEVSEYFAFMLDQLGATGPAGASKTTLAR